MQTTFSPYRVLLSGALLLTALLSTFVLLGLMAHPAQAAMPTYVGGPITTNTTWTTANSPYILTETVAIVAGVTLTVEPGVTVMGQPGVYFFVEGHLQAVGTVTTPITFTSQQDSAPNQWTGISFVGGSSHLQHVTVRYGEFNIGIGVIDPDAQIVIEDSTISQSAGYGIDIALGSLHQLVLSNTTFAANYRNRISIYDWPTDNLVTHTVLSPQPGLEGYEFRSSTSIIEVPQGITLTVEPGTTLLFSDESLVIRVSGHLEAIGTAVSPITFTGVPEGPSTGAWGGIGVIGSANFNYVTIDKASWSFGVWEAKGGNVQIENSTISNSSDYPMTIEVPALHRVNMLNVSFVNNITNRVLIEAWNEDSLTNNVTLFPQPGLEGYEFKTNTTEIAIPEGITLTIKPGATLLFSDEWTILEIRGHLEAVGTQENPITFTSFLEMPVQDWALEFEGGSGYLRYVHLHHNTITVWQNYSLDRQVIIENSSIQDSDWYAIDITSDSLHSLALSNVTFTNNYTNRVLIYTDFTPSTLIADVTLSPQPGLEAYEITENPYPRDGGLVVPPGLTMTVEPGVTLMQAEYVLPLRVEGTLQALGTAVSPITFTSATNSAAGEWAGIVVSGTADFAHTTVRYAQTGVTVAGGAVSAVCSTFTNNLADGVYVDNTGSPTVNLSASGIFGNGGWNLFNNNSTQVDARYNWWGSPSDPASTINGNVLYTPWLTEPTCPAPPPIYHLSLPLVLAP